MAIPMPLEPDHLGRRRSEVYEEQAPIPVMAQYQLSGDSSYPRELDGSTGHSALHESPERH
jgi:hypothetical protein